jgi:hypothetical protein
MTPDDDRAPPDEASDPAARPSQPPPADERARRLRLERILPELIKRGLERGIEAGLGTLNRTGEAVGGVVGDVVGDVKPAREIANYVFGAIDDTKNAMVRVVAREVREFLEATDLSKELQKALTSLSFEIKTEIRFIPNDAGAGVKPDVRAGVATVKRKRADGGEDVSTFAHPPAGGASTAASTDDAGHVDDVPRSLIGRRRRAKARRT